MKQYILVLSAVLLGCESPEQVPLVYEAETQQFEIIVPAKGELFAAKATVISAPTGRRQKNIAWLAPEYSLVKKGEVIARFDGEQMEQERRGKANELAINEQDMIEKTGVLSKDLNVIRKDIDVVGQETEFAETYSIDDVQIMSKLDIIDSMQNTEYLRSKRDYLGWKEDSFTESSEGEMGLLELKSQQHQIKLDQLQEGLSKLEIVAPHDGLFTYESNWQGEKVREGQTLWPGQKIAQLPDISEMKAKLNVFESEAINLKAGQKVVMVLNTVARERFTGVVESVAPYPKSIERGNPQKYFEVIAVLDEQHAGLFVPGRKIEAEIEVSGQSERLIVPLQSIFNDNNQTFVYQLNGSEFEPVNVELGQTSLSHVEVLSGLEDGAQISLVDLEAH